MVGSGLHEGDGVALLYIPLFLRGGWLKQNSVQVYGEGVAYKKGAGLQERIRYIT